MNVLRVVDRQRADVVVEPLPGVAVEQILLDVRGVEHAHRRVVHVQVARDRPQRLRPGEIADQRHDQVAHLQVAQRPVDLLARQVAPLHARPIVARSSGPGRSETAASRSRARTNTGCRGRRCRTRDRRSRCPPGRRGSGRSRACPGGARRSPSGCARRRPHRAPLSRTRRAAPSRCRRGVVPAGTGRENSRDRNSSRVGDISISALYIRCSSMFCRRMSTMKAMRGLSAAM